MAKLVEKQDHPLAFEDEQGNVQKGRKRKTRGSSRLSFPDSVDRETNGDGADAAAVAREEVRKQQILGSLGNGRGVAISSSLPDSHGFLPRTRAAGWSVSEASLEARYRNSFGYRAGYLPRNRAYLDGWHRNLQSKAHRSLQISPAVANLQTLIDTDPIIRMYVTEMIDQVPEAHKVVADVPELLQHLSTIVVTAPEYNADPNQRHAFPMTGLFAYMMMTPAGQALFRSYTFNEAIRAILKEWCDYLESADSAKVLTEEDNGWLSPFAYQDFQLYEFDLDKTKPHWGLVSYNDYFHRAIKKEARPIAGPGDPTIIVSANDGHVLAIARDVQPSQEFLLKGELYSLTDILSGSKDPFGKPYIDRFVGGYVFHTFLSGANYHRWHAPVDGTMEAIVTPPNGLLFSNAESAGFDPDGVLSEVYFTAVNTRMLMFITAANAKIGTVCVMPIGITEISSVQTHLQPGDVVTKGDELGRFSYGGSSLVILFERGAIDHFTAPVPPSGDFDPSSGPPILVNAQIAIANA